MQNQEYFNFLNSLNSPATKKRYSYRLEQFLNYCKQDLHSFLKLPDQKITSLITEYLVQKNLSKSTKNVILHSIKHACDMNDVILNWKKIKKFVKSEKTGNELSSNNRGYNHAEIQQILNFSEQRVKTAFLILASTGMRIGALGSLKYGDLERIDDLYKFTVYSDDQDDKYMTFSTPETTKEIDAYLEFRRRRGEYITSDSHVIVKKFGYGQKSEPFKGDSLRALLQDCVNNSGLREIEHDKEKRYKRKQIPVLHGLRKFFTKQLVDSKVQAEIRELLHGWDIGLTGKYYRPTQQDMLNEYLKAVPLLTISNEERLKFKLEEHIQIKKTEMESMREEMDKFKEELAAMKKRQKKK